MIVAINTASLDLDTPNAVARAAALGFKHIEVNLQANEFDYGYRRRPNVRFYRDLKRQIDNLNLSVWSITPPELTQEQMFSARARKEILMGSAGAGGILGSKVYVARPVDIFKDEDAYNTYLESKKAPPVTSGFDETWVQAVNRRMTMALLNQDYWIGSPLTNQTDAMKKILDDLAVGCAFDLPRALNRNSLPTWLEAIGDRLAVAYLYGDPDDERSAAPAAEAWKDQLTLLSQTRLKCLVVRANQSQSDDEIRQSKTAIEPFITG